MKPLSILTLLLASAACAAEVEAGSQQQVTELLKFNETFNVFFRDLIGCPKWAVDVKDCNPKRGLWNQAAWRELTTQAPRVFPQPQQKKKRHWWLLWAK